MLVRLSPTHHQRTLLIGVILLGLLLGVSPAQAAPAAQAAPVTRNEISVNYPESVTFQLALSTDADVAAAELLYRLDRFSCVPATAQVPVPVDGVDLAWTWVMNRSGNPPPGATMTWAWQLTDGAGAVTTTEWQTHTFSDDRFDWQTVASEDVRLHWYGPDDIGPLLIDAANAGLAQLEADMGIELQTEVQFFIYSSSEDMRDALIYVQDWAGGLAFADYNIILIGVPTEIAATWGVETVRHELAHLVIGQFGRSCVGGQRPTWLNEGLAVYAEGAPDGSTLADITRATEENSLMPVRSLSGSFPAHDSGASLAYTQSYSLVDFLLTTYGQAEMQALLLTLAAGAGYDEALENVYGFNMDGLETAWRAAIGAPARAIPPTPTPLSAAAVPTYAPLASADQPTPPAAAATAAPFTNEPAGATTLPFQCSLAMIPLLGLAFISTGHRLRRRQPRPARRNRSHRFLPLFLALSALMFACQLSSTAPTDLAPNETIRLVGGQPRTLDPALTFGGPGGALGHIFGGLVSLDSNLQVQPELAAGWDISDDGLAYTFFLRRDAVFHDGRPITASDIIFSWERAADPATGSDLVGTYLGDIVGVPEKMAGAATAISGLRAIDDHTLRVDIDAPKVYFLAKLAYPVAYVVDENNVGRPNWERQPNGTGPYYLETWRDDEVLVLTRHEGYWQPAAVRHIVYQIGQGIPLSMYETDEIDLTGIGGSTLARAQDPNDPLAPDLRTAVDMCTHYFGFDTTRPPFDDARVRQAFYLALDREALVNALYRGSALTANGILPPGMPGYLNRPDPYPFNPDQARRLMAEAGYGDPAAWPVVTFHSAGYNSAGGMIEAAVTMWQAELGVTIDVTLIDPFIYFEALTAGDTGNIFDSGWCADYPDPENFLDILFHGESGQNLTQFNDPTINALLSAARSEPDAAARLAHYQEIEAQILASAPALVTHHTQSAVLVKSRLQGYVLSPIGIRQWHRVTITSPDP